MVTAWPVMRACWSRYSISEGGSSGRSTGTKTAKRAEAAAMAVQIPDSGPRPGRESSTTGACATKEARADEAAPAIETGILASRKVETARAINGSPSKGKRALSLPIRLDWPPARTKPAASEIAAESRSPSPHTQWPTSSRKRISDSMPRAKFFRLNFSLGAWILSSGRPKPIMTLGRPR